MINTLYLYKFEIFSRDVAEIKSNEEKINTLALHIGLQTIAPYCVSAPASFLLSSPVSFPLIFLKGKSVKCPCPRNFIIHYEEFRIYILPVASCQQKCVHNGMYWKYSIPVPTLYPIYSKSFLCFSIRVCTPAMPFALQLHLGKGSRSSQYIVLILRNLMTSLECKSIL